MNVTVPVKSISLLMLSVSVSFVNNFALSFFLQTFIVLGNTYFLYVLYLFFIIKLIGLFDKIYAHKFMVTNLNPKLTKQWLETRSEPCMLMQLFKRLPDMLDLFLPFAYFLQY